MPKGDRTGPMGIKNMGGRAAGYCAGFDTPGYANPLASGGAGMRMGRSRGGWGSPTAGGRGWLAGSCAARGQGRRRGGGHGFWPQPVNPEAEAEFLRSRSRALQSELEVVNKRLADIEPQEKAP